MARPTKQSNRRKRTNLTIREQTQCRFCREGKNYIDYKDVDVLQKLLTNREQDLFPQAQRQLRRLPA